jgi:hypothetical protein
LNNRKAILMTAVIAVLGALRYHPDKQQLLIYDLFYNNRYPTNNDDITLYTTKKMSSSAANPENHLPIHHKEIMKIAEGLYDQLLKATIDNTIYPPTATKIKEVESAYISRSGRCDSRGIRSQKESPAIQHAVL